MVCMLLPLQMGLWVSASWFRGGSSWKNSCLYCISCKKQLLRMVDMDCVRQLMICSLSLCGMEQLVKSTIEINSNIIASIKLLINSLLGQCQRSICCDSVNLIRIRLIYQNIFCRIVSSLMPLIKFLLGMMMLYYVFIEKKKLMFLSMK